MPVFIGIMVEPVSKLPLFFFLTYQANSESSMSMISFNRVLFNKRKMFFETSSLFRIAVAVLKSKTKWKKQNKNRGLVRILYKIYRISFGELILQIT